MLFLSSSAAPGGEHEGRFGGVGACWTGALRHPVPRCVPLVRQAEGAQQPQPDGAAGADVSEALATVDDTQQKLLFGGKRNEDKDEIVPAVWRREKCLQSLYFY